MHPKNKRKAEFLNITDYHDKGYKGQGVNIAVYDLNFQHHLLPRHIRQKVKPLRDNQFLLKHNNRDHGYKVVQVIHQIAPDANIYFDAAVGFNRFLETVKERGDIDIVSISMTGGTRLSDAVDDMDIVMSTSAGNDGIEGTVRMPGAHPNFITVSSTHYHARKGEYVRSSYSTVDDLVDVASLNAWHVKGFDSNANITDAVFRGTSSTAPAVAGMMALYMSANGKISGKQARDLIRDNVMDLYKQGRDAKTGYGIFKLPQQIPQKLKQKGGVIMPDFEDVKGHWAEKAIINQAKKGRLSGFPDGTFKPDEPITRAQLAVILDRLDRE